MGEAEKGEADSVDPVLAGAVLWEPVLPEADLAEPVVGEAELGELVLLEIDLLQPVVGEADLQMAGLEELGDRDNQT